MKDVNNVLFYINIDSKTIDKFYYNQIAKVNDIVANKVGMEIANRYISDEALKIIKSQGQKLTKKRGRGEFGIIGTQNEKGETQYFHSGTMMGIRAQVNAELAEEILERAKYYCPVKSGKLRDSGFIEYLPDGSCRITFKCDYAWYVHEFTWLKHELPGRPKFLYQAIQDVMEEHGLK